MEEQRRSVQLLLAAYLWASRRRDGGSNISVVHATDFGSSLWKSRNVAASKKLLSDNAARYEYLSIQLAVFTRG